MRFNGQIITSLFINVERTVWIERVVSWTVKTVLYIKLICTVNRYQGKPQWLGLDTLEILI